MGQCATTALDPDTISFPAPFSSGMIPHSPAAAAAGSTSRTPRDGTADLPDECLELIFLSLSSGDRKRCSLVCRRWFVVDARCRHRLSLDARVGVAASIPALFGRFNSVSKLALKCNRRSDSIDDAALALIALHCPKLTRLKIRSCRALTAAGMEALALHCPRLRKLSCGSCAFGSKGIEAVLRGCSSLEELSVKRLRGLSDAAANLDVLPGAAASSLRSICLKELFNGQCFGTLIAGSTNLRTLKIFRCSGDWDRLLEDISVTVPGIVEIHLEKLQVSDRGLLAISTFSSLEVLHLVKTPECTDSGLAAIAERCRFIRKVHIDGWKTNRIGDNGLMAVARRCVNLQELVLIGVNPTALSLELIATNCRSLERLALCSSETFGDAEISCIAARCVALKKLCIKGCPVSDHGMEALVEGCPNLVKVKVKKCRGVTQECADWLRANRGTLAVNLDAPSSADHPDGGGDISDGGILDNTAELATGMAVQVRDGDLPSSSSGILAFAKARKFLALNLFRRWTSHGGGGLQQA